MELDEIVESESDQKVIPIIILPTDLLADNANRPIYDPNSYDFSKVHISVYDFRDYIREREMHMTDFRVRADKTIQRFPQGYMPGVLGFTYLGENVINLRLGSGAYDVELNNQYIIRHESGHTPNEHETRVIDHLVHDFSPVALNEIYPIFLPKYKI
ncbi:MAG: hypothetical protein ACMXYG_07395 [Candidatus Woesearchaeota archaeon]